MWKYVILFLTVGTFLIDTYFAFVSFGFRKKHCSKCKGYLTDTAKHKNVYVGRSNGRFYRHYLNYSYAYQVNGKAYYISGGIPGTKGNVNKTVDVIYQRKNPKLAYIQNLTIPLQPIVAVLLFPLWIALTVCCIFLI